MASQTIYASCQYCGDALPVEIRVEYGWDMDVDRAVTGFKLDMTDLWAHDLIHREEK